MIGSVSDRYLTDSIIANAKSELSGIIDTGKGSLY
jgi:hypothetical protein